VDPCVGCAGCCRGGPTWGVWVTPDDVVREPLLATHAPLMAATGLCPFLSGDRCSIYVTRPDCCRRFEVGGSRCLEARLQIGLPALPREAV
jgi:Fe-S-cluster containining protein